MLTDGIEPLSYVVGDTEAGTAVVIDPRTVVDIYLYLARKHGVFVGRWILHPLLSHEAITSSKPSMGDALGATAWLPFVGSMVRPVGN